jgi:hypothetical protein
MLAIQEQATEVLVLLRGDVELAERLDVRGTGEGLVVAQPGFQYTDSLPDGRLL